MQAWQPGSPNVWSRSRLTISGHARDQMALRCGDHKAAIRAFDDVTAELPGKVGLHPAAAAAYALCAGLQSLKVATALSSAVARVGAGRSSPCSVSHTAAWRRAIMRPLPR